MGEICIGGNIIHRAVDCSFDTVIRVIIVGGLIDSERERGIHSSHVTVGRRSIGIADSRSLPAAETRPTRLPPHHRPPSRMKFVEASTRAELQAVSGH